MRLFPAWPEALDRRATTPTQPHLDTASLVRDARNLTFSAAEVFTA
jgi:hypothetical protein